MPHAISCPTCAVHTKRCNPRRITATSCSSQPGHASAYVPMGGSNTGVSAAAPAPAPPRVLISTAGPALLSASPRSAAMIYCHLLLWAVHKRRRLWSAP